MTQILCFSGSLRAASSATALMRALAERLPQGIAADTADIGSLPHYNADHDGGPAVARLIAQIGAADGLLFVTPEYNYSIPGVLKNAIDWASRPAYRSVLRGKSCLVISVSGGALGGVRAQAHPKFIPNGMLAEVFPWPEVVVPEAPKRLTGGVRPMRSANSSAGIQPATSRLPSCRSTIGSSASSPSGKSPAMARSTSIAVTIPSKWPYSSWTSTMCAGDARRVSSTSSAAIPSRTTGASTISGRKSGRRGPRPAASTSRARRTPTMSSGPPSRTGRRECPVSRKRRRIASGGSARSASSTSVRGTIRPRAVRSAMRMTPAIISVSAGSITPADRASARTILTSSSVTPLSARPDWPSSASTRRPDRSSSQTRGAATSAITCSSGAIRVAAASGARRAICLGTSSPKTSDR
ncbi:MAG: NAD(P)H-dependent oxidoreductase [Rhodobacterales bacterium]|nr:NAD(P)H-dependent oxidoreductase [Rhodobacterales bacterium]